MNKESEGAKENRREPKRTRGTKNDPKKLEGTKGTKREQIKPKAFK